MTKIKTFVQLLAFAAFFAFLFHKQSFGLNLFLLDFAVLAWLFVQAKIRPDTRLSLLLIGAVAVTAIAVLVVNSIISILINILLMLTLAGWLGLRNAKSALFVGISAAENLLKSQLQFFHALYKLFFAKSGNNKPVSLARKIAFVLSGLVVILVFTSIYAAANPWFNARVSGIFGWISDFFEALSAYVDEDFVFFLILGVIIGNLFLFHLKNSKLARFEATLSDQLTWDVNEENESTATWTARSAIVMLAILNVLLFWVNLLDLQNVWLYFEWQGEYLKQFVHEGTYMLLFSIGLSILLVIVIYNQRSTSLQKNKLLKGLTYFWILQNVFLVLSVGMRNYWYMSYFALAYKRIAVVFFLILLLYGLYSVFTKVAKTRSLSYLFKVNANAFLLVVTLAALPNWDAIIARYNLAHYQQSFVHFDFLAGLSDKTLPILDLSPAKLEEIDQAQQQLFFFEDNFMDANSFGELIGKRKKAFEADWQQKGIFSWNYADARAYKRLTSKD